MNCAAIIDRSVTDAMSEFVQRSMIFWNHAVECNDLLEWNTHTSTKTLLDFSTYLFPQWLTLIIYIIISDSQLLIQGDQNYHARVIEMNGFLE